MVAGLENSQVRGLSRDRVRPASWQAESLSRNFSAPTAASEYMNSRADGRRQRYEERQGQARTALPDPSPPTQAQLREYLGDELFARIGLSGMDDDACDTEHMRDRYFAEGGLTLFLSEGFPNTTSLKPFGPGQLRAIGIVESVIRHGGVEQSLEPRGFAKSSRVARAAIWAMLGGFRRCGVIFQSNKDKAEETLQKVKNELAGSPFLRALSPGIWTACRHAQVNPGLLAKRQHYEGELTNIQWLIGSIRLPNVLGETGGGARLICMPFAKAAGLSLSDPLTLEDVRPDLLLPDDVQSHDDASSPRITEKLLSIWHGSVRYLCGRGKAGATVFTQTIFSAEDMADQLSRDPSVHTVRYQFLEEFPANMEWWQGDYKKTLLGYDPLDEGGQIKARRAATALYLANREQADAGAKVSWDHAYDPDVSASAIQQAMNNFLENEQAFWAQDQNDPQAIVSEDDIRCKPAEIMAKQHGEDRNIVPEWADKIVCHIDVHDSLLYYGVCAGSATMQMGLIDRQTWPRQKQLYYTLRAAAIKLDSEPRYAELPTLADRIKVALGDLVSELLGRDFATAAGVPVKVSTIGIDCSDGDHWDTVHAFVRESKHTCLIPMRGVAPTAAQTPLNARPKAKSEKRRGDHWIEKLSDRTRVKWLEFDANYFKTKIHKGLRAPLGTSESVSLWQASSEKTHHLIADHCNAEIPAWTTAKRANEVTNGVYQWTLKLAADNHAFDNLVGCLVLLNHAGGNFADVQAAKAKPTYYKASEIQRQKRAQRLRAGRYA